MRQNWKALLTSRVSVRSWRIGLDQDIFDKPREKAVAEFRLEVNCDCFADHLQRIGIFASPNWPLCKKDEAKDRNHLLGCSALRGDYDVKRYRITRHLLKGH
ncbi:hypothetical protein TNCT_667621 [Trichonephila clavata]|uniref:Uncharacterized protein n=1 Tax=Trichonephila clavata TaxID=2740835 RepID=A0A8X6GLJ1_TRICU|nr:hypothetical protein TNCT_667621 [Trichonephila clavata]